MLLQAADEPRGGHAALHSTLHSTGGVPANRLGGSFLRPPGAARRSSPFHPGLGSEADPRLGSEPDPVISNHLRVLMTRGEAAAFSRNPAAGSRFLGQAVHRETAQSLFREYGGRVEYRRAGPDFLDTFTGQRIELTTPGQVGAHMRRPGYDGVSYSTYMLPSNP